MQREWSAGEVDLADRRLAEIQKAAEAFENALWTHRGSSDAERDATYHVENVLDRALSQCPTLSFYRGPADFRLEEEDDPTLELPFDEPLVALAFGVLLPSLPKMIPRDDVAARLDYLSVRNISGLMTQFLGACIDAQRQLEKDRAAHFYKRGEAWYRFVGVNLAHFWSGLSPAHKVTVSKSGKPSPFVSFINALQWQFPEKFRSSSTGSDRQLAGSALSEAVHKAWRKAQAEKPDPIRVDVEPEAVPEEPLAHVAAWKDHCNLMREICDVNDWRIPARYDPARVSGDAERD